MRFVVVVLFLASLLTAAAPVTAQIPYLQIYFDDDHVQAQGYCQGLGVIDTLYATAFNLNMWLKTIEFSIEFPPPNVFQWIGDVHSSPLHLGISPTGVTITWPIPQNAFQPFIVMRAAIIWLCSDCEDVSWTYVRPHPGTGKILAIRWPDYGTVEPYGLDSQICSYIANEETTWGRIKALYQ